jgi:hypothetical protein
LRYLLLDGLHDGLPGRRFCMPKEGPEQTRLKGETRHTSLRSRRVLVAFMRPSLCLDSLQAYLARASGLRFRLRG